MATKGKGATPSRKTSIPVGSFPVPPVPMDGNRSGKQDWENVMGWIAACVLLVMLLPLLGMLYVDVLQTKHEAKQQVEKVEKLRRQVENSERKNRDKEPSNNSDNPVVNRL
jgi:hypothetical protein